MKNNPDRKEKWFENPVGNLAIALVWIAWGITTAWGNFLPACEFIFSTGSPNVGMVNYTKATISGQELDEMRKGVRGFFLCGIGSFLLLVAFCRFLYQLTNPDGSDPAPGED